MASNLSPSGSEDFIMLEPHQIHDLPLRQRPSGDEAEQDHDFDTSSDDDLEHISRPGSVRSLNTPSPFSSPLLVPATQGDSTAVSSLTLQVSDTTSQLSRTSENHHQAEQSLPTHNVSNVSHKVLPRTTSQTQALPPPTSHSHASIDQEIMDNLIEHALTTRIEQEHDHGSSKDQNLRQQMMTRFRSLPADHSVVKGSIFQLDGSKTLFQGQKRTPAEIEQVYRLVFTDIDRCALYRLSECHIKHFEAPCHLFNIFVQLSQSQLQYYTINDQKREGKELANTIQSKILNSLNMKRPLTQLFKDLKGQTRSRMNTYLELRFHEKDVKPVMPSRSDEIGDTSEWRARIASNVEHQLANMRTIFYRTVAEIEPERYDYLDHCSITGSIAAKREPPEDDVESDSACLGPPSKRFQPYIRGRQNFASKTVSITEPSASNLRPTDLEFCGHSRLMLPVHQQKVPVDTRDDHPLQDYPVQLSLLQQQPMERQDACRLEAEKIRSAQPKFEERDESRCMMAKASMSAQMERLRENQRRVMASMGTSMSEWPGMPADSTPLNDHFSAQSRNALAGAEGPAREYRQDTLLARSTQLPIPPARGTSGKMPGSWGSDSPHIGAESEHGEGDPADLKARRGYSFAPAFQPDESSKTINEWKAQMRLLEENREKERQAARMRAQTMQAIQEQQMRAHHKREAKRQSQGRENLEIADESRRESQPFVQFPPDPPADCQEPFQTLTMQTWGPCNSRLSYQKQLMLLESQNKSRLMRAREEGRRQFEGDGANMDYSGNQTRQHHSGPTEILESYVKNNPDYQKQLAILEQQNRKRLMLQREDQERQKLHGNSDSTARMGKQIAQDRAVSLETQGLGAVTLDQKRQMKQVNRLGVSTDREEVERRRASKNLVCKTWCGTAPIRENTPSKEIQRTHPIVWEDNNGVTWIAFEYEGDGGKMEYTIRGDIESVDTDQLAWFFKDVNCLHEWCEGWMSTAERTRRAQTAYVGRVNEPYQYPPRGTQGEHNDSASFLRQRLAENKMAWSLAELNPCLRVTGTRPKGVLWTAVKNYMSLQQPQNVSARQEPRRSHELPSPSTGDTRTGLQKDPFVVQSADEIMNDAHLDDSSSSEDEDDDCSYVSEEPAPDSDFPSGFFDGKDVRYLTFEFYSSSTSSTHYYTVRADAESIKCMNISRPFTDDKCICGGIWKQQQAKKQIHCHDCNLALALGELNPVLQGKEKEEIRVAAMTNYMFMEILKKWPSTMSNIEKELLSEMPVLNAELKQEDVDDGFVLFKHGPPGYTPGACAQCNYCNSIVDGGGYGVRVKHLARCDGLARRGEIRMGT